MERFSAVLLALLVIFSCTMAVAQKVSDISDHVIRLHVIANSDSDEDQACKLAVRDALLNCSEEYLGVGASKEEALKNAEKNLEVLRQVAEETVRKQGFSYDVQIELCTMDFPEKTYDDLVMPAGTYDAVRIILGEGSGQNWWCVMYPPLCVPAAEKIDPDDVFTKEEQDLLYKKEGYTVQFAVLEFFKEVGRFFGNLMG